MRRNGPWRSRDASTRVLRRKKNLRASMRKHCTRGLRAPQAFEKELCNTSSFMLGEVTAPKCYYRGKVFHELNASSADLLQSVFVFSLHLLYSVPIGASLSSSLVRLEMKWACTCSGKLCCVAGALFVVGFAFGFLEDTTGVTTPSSKNCTCVSPRCSSKSALLHGCTRARFSPPAHRLTGSPAHRLTAWVRACVLGEGFGLFFFVQDEQATEGWEGREGVKVKALLKWISDTS